MTTVDLAAWLLVQLDEDERLAQGCATETAAAGPGRGVHVDDQGRGLAAAGSNWAIAPAAVRHIARWDPARVSAEVSAKRRILAQHSPHAWGGCPTCWHSWTRSTARETYPCQTLRLLALPYADRPGYLDEWRPVYTVTDPGNPCFKADTCTLNAECEREASCRSLVDEWRPA